MSIAIVTGASSGMGREFVLQLSEYVKVDEIWVIARRQAALESLREEVSVPIRPVILDLGQSASFDAYANLLEEEKPDVKLLVNAAGFGKFGDFQRISPEDDCKMIDLNCKALVMMTRLTLPYMHAGSHILQLDSLSAFQPVPYITTYGATKAFVLSYSRAINRELKNQGIRVMAMNPGWVKTEFFNHAFQTNQSEVQYFDRLYEAKDVVATGLKDLYKSKKDYSIHGFPVRMQVRLVKLLPHSMVMNTWLKQQKKAKNNQGLTVEGRK
ncbi:MAG: SDR family NAD(P)-dependent oxidoreductase [Oscillospiraceae bacterium]|nr:SDR family NAD(P)-dependent oxidoreductase [Oscillospiraceae bacterium]